MEGEGRIVPNGAEGVECMSGLVDPALDVFFGDAGQLSLCSLVSV